MENSIYKVMQDAFCQMRVVASEAAIHMLDIHGYVQGNVDYDLKVDWNFLITNLIENTSIDLGYERIWMN